MTEPREARSIIDDAERAAAAGNYSSAEELLREAAAVQEQTLGSHHQDLANTLNNLGVVCEMTDNPIDAEHYFRRAYAIAAASLPPDHPFVATSHKNLQDFCTARGRPLELPPSPPEVAAWLDTPAPRAEPLHESSPPTKSQDHASIPQKRPRRSVAFGAFGGVAVLAVILVMARPWGSRPAEIESPEPARTATSEAPAPRPTPAPAEPAAQQQPTAKPAPPSRREADAGNGGPSSRTTSSAAPTVVTARLCTALSAWRCEAAESQVAPGPLFFYTQVRSATATTIEHRWYQGDRLRQAVQLRIQANPDAGYRTYSRYATNSERVGDWRVELRSADGAVLHEERFTVR